MGLLSLLPALPTTLSHPSIQEAGRKAGVQLNGQLPESPGLDDHVLSDS
jgi:hypothetical protein